MRYTVKRPLRRQSQKYGPGDTVDMGEAEAKPLLQLGTLEKPAQSESQSGSGDQKSEARKQVEAMTVQQLTEALQELEVEVPGDAKKADLVNLYLESTQSDEE